MPDNVAVLIAILYIKLHSDHYSFSKLHPNYYSLSLSDLQKLLAARQLSDIKRSAARPV